MQNIPPQVELEKSPQNQNDNEPDKTSEQNLQQVENKIDTATHNVVDAGTKVPDEDIKKTLDSIASSLMEVKTSIESLSSDVRKVTNPVKKEEKKEEKKSPDVTVDEQIKYKAIRKRGGRLVRRKA